MTAVSRPTRPRASALRGSDTAKRIAIVILEVLSGSCGPAEGSERLGLSLPRYYALETRGLQALLQALEPRGRGRQPPPDGGAQARRTQQRLEGEVLRLQALVRAMQRAVAVAPAPKDAARRRRKATPRARKVIAQLRAVPEAAETPGS